MHESFDQVYGEPDEPFYYGLRPTRELEEYLERVKPSGGKALDLGCGEGRNTLLLARYGFYVHAVDISAKGLRKLEKYAHSHGLEGVEYIVADVRQFQPRPDFYDVVVAVTLLDHLEREEGRKVVETIQSALKPGGFTFIEVFTRHDPGARLASEKRAGEGISDTASFIKHYFNDGELAAWFAGLELTHYEEKIEYDDKHGTPHFHGLARLIGIKRSG